MNWADIGAIVFLGLAIVAGVLSWRGMKGKDQFSDDNDQGL